MRGRGGEHEAGCADPQSVDLLRQRLGMIDGMVCAQFADPGLRFRPRGDRDHGKAGQRRQRQPRLRRSRETERVLTWELGRWTVRIVTFPFRLDRNEGADDAHSGLGVDAMAVTLAHRIESTRSYEVGLAGL